MEELKERLCEKFPHVEIILYGSKARGDYREFSDLDILILVDSRINSKFKKKITETKYDIEVKNPRPEDVALICPHRGLQCLFAIHGL